MMYRTLATSLAALLLVGCGNSVSTVSNSEKPGAYTVFDSANGTLAYPNNILFAGSADGTLNIPFDPTAPDAAIKSQLNTLDGFSTTSPITLPLTAAINESTLAGNVRVFKVTVVASPQTLGIPAVVATEQELTYGSDFVTALSGDKITVVPLKPLEGHSNYMVVVTDSVRAANGGLLAPDATTAMLNGSKPLVDAQGNPTAYFHPDAAANTQTAMQLEGLRQLTQMMFAQAGAAGIDAKHIVTAWSFQTQTIGEVQNHIAADAAAYSGSMLALQDAGLTTKTLFASLGMDTSLMTNGAEIYAGTLSNVPQYMPQPSDANDTTPISQGKFTYSAPFTPVVEANATLPVFATVPSGDSNCTMPAAGWPVVIYQHGITRSRTDLAVYGETLASKCYAGVAIDLPLHGVTDPANPFYMSPIERTFNADLVTENPYGTVVAFVPDGVIDSTGINFMNLAHVITTRDNLQQTTSDLTVLADSIGSAVGVKLDGNRVAFVSHSLGNIAAAGFLNHTTAVNSAVLMMPGQQLIPFLGASTVFGPIINGGLAAFGIMPGSPEYAAFMLSTQTLVDDADPANYTISIGASAAMPILEMQAIGDGSEGSGDQHIPATVDGAPLSGSEPFIQFTGAKDLNASKLTDIGIGYLYTPDTNRTVSRITAGEHRSPLDPQYSLNAFFEYHTELISFIDSKGSAILVNDPSIIKQ